MCSRQISVTPSIYLDNESSPKSVTKMTLNEKMTHSTSDSHSPEYSILVKLSQPTQGQAELTNNDSAEPDQDISEGLDDPLTEEMIDEYLQNRVEYDKLLNDEQDLEEELPFLQRLNKIRKGLGEQTSKNEITEENPLATKSNQTLLQAVFEVIEESEESTNALEHSVTMALVGAFELLFEKQD
jgi:hypothetical protein